jgi:DNA-binding LacI/PurR family transcriptional regulator
MLYFFSETIHPNDLKECSLMLKPLPTAKDVARLAGVSTTTVSYVLNGRGKDQGTISATTRQRVLEAVASLGYVPNQNARHLRCQRTERICLVLPRLGVPTYDVLVHDVERVAEKYGYTLMIALGDSPEHEQHVVDQLQRRFADGAIFIHGYALEARLSLLTNIGLPLVILHNHIAIQGCDIVRTNEIEACYEAVCYLLTTGYRRIAFLGNLPHDEKSEQYDRCQSYLRALQTYHIDVDEHYVCWGALTRNDAYTMTQNLLLLEKRPDAIFAASDVAAISAIWAIRDAGLRIPEDIAVIGVGNIAEGAITSPPLTTVGMTGLDFTILPNLLFSRMENMFIEERTHTLHWQLILRQSA